MGFQRAAKLQAGSRQCPETSARLRGAVVVEKGGAGGIRLLSILGSYYCAFGAWLCRCQALQVRFPQGSLARPAPSHDPLAPSDPHRCSHSREGLAPSAGGCKFQLPTCDRALSKVRLKIRELGWRPRPLPPSCGLSAVPLAALGESSVLWTALVKLWWRGRARAARPHFNAMLFAARKQRNALTRSNLFPAFDCEGTNAAPVDRFMLHRQRSTRQFRHAPPHIAPSPLRASLPRAFPPLTFMRQTEPSCIPRTWISASGVGGNLGPVSRTPSPAAVLARCSIPSPPALTPESETPNASHPMSAICAPLHHV